MSYPIGAEPAPMPVYDLNSVRNDLVSCVTEVYDLCLRLRDKANMAFGVVPMKEADTSNAPIPGEVETIQKLIGDLQNTINGLRNEVDRF